MLNGVFRLWGRFGVDEHLLKMPNLGIIMPNMGTKGSKGPRNQPLSMVDALFSRTQQNVLALLYGQPDRSFYTNEIINRSGSGSGAVQRELSRLVRSGLATSQRIGAQKHYQANPEAPIYGELTALVQKTVGLVEPLREALKPIYSRIHLAFVYGSVAKRVDTATSDIDLMVVSDELSYADVYPVLEELSTKWARKVEPTIYTRDELNSRLESDNAFIKRVLDQPKLWLLGSERDLPAR
jgi:predicted nucleotidyltransferase